MMPNPNDNSSVLISTNKLVHFMTDDTGRNWRVLEHQNVIHTFVFHPTRALWGLLSSWTDACDSAHRNDGVCKHMLYLTKDGGHTFPIERMCSFGKIGEFGRRAIWRRFGFGRDFVFEISVSDPVKVVLIGAYAKATAR